MDENTPITEKEKEEIFFNCLISVYDRMIKEYRVDATTIVNGVNKFKREICNRLNKADGDRNG
jgi:hypothetical protein